MDVKLTFFNEVNQKEEHDASDIENNEEAVHEDKMTTQLPTIENQNNPKKRLYSISACEIIFDVFSQCSEQFVIQHSWSLIQIY